MKHKKPVIQLDHAYFAKQRSNLLKRLQASADRYDEGDFDEAKSMASDIAKLLIDSPKNRSLLAHLGEQPKSMFAITLLGDIKRQTDWHGPYITQGYIPVGKSHPVPILDGMIDYPDWVPNQLLEIENWWKDPVVRDGLNKTLSRFDVVKTMRDKEAQHTDSTLPFTYGNLAYRKSLNLMSVEPYIEAWDDNITHLIIRQTTHEVLRTLVADYPKKFSIATGGLAYPANFISVGYKNYAGEVKQLHQYEGYKYRIIWAGSEEEAEDWKSTLPAAIGEFVPPEISFFGERAPSGVKPSSIRIQVINQLPYSLSVETSFRIDPDGTIILITVLHANP